MRVFAPLAVVVGLLVLVSRAGLAQPELVPGDVATRGNLAQWLQQVRATDPAVREQSIEKLAGALENPQVYAQVLLLLKDPQPAVRISAVTVLGRHTDEKTLAPLTAALQDVDAEVRLAAAQELMYRRYKRAIPVLMALLAAREAAVRAQAARLLGESGYPWTADSLARLLTDKEASVRAAAAVALGELHDARALAPLLALVDTAEAELRLDVIYALGVLEDIRAVEPLIALLRAEDSDLLYEAAGALQQIATAHPGDPGMRTAVEPLIALLASPEESIRISALDTLGMSGDQRAINPVLACTDEPNTTVRQRAYSALLRLDTARGLPAVQAGLRSPDAQLRLDAWNAAWALGPAMAARFLDTLVSLLDDKDKAIRKFAVERLTMLRTDPRALPALLRAFTGPEAEIRIHAINGLDDQHDRRIIAPLIIAGKDPDAQVRSTALEALRRFHDPRITELALGMLRDPDATMRQQGAELLGYCGAQRARRQVLAALNDADAGVRKAAASALDQYGYRDELRSREVSTALRPLLADPDGAIRAVALRFLGTTREADALAALLAAVQDPDPTVRIAALRGLQNLGPVVEAEQPRAVTALLTACQDTDRATRLAAIQAIDAYDDDPRVIAALCDIARAGDPELAQAAMSTLADVADPRVAEMVDQALRNPQLQARVYSWISNLQDDPRVTATLLQMLRHHDPKVRAQAIRSFGRTNPPELIPALIALLPDAAQSIDLELLTSLQNLRSFDPPKRWQYGDDDVAGAVVIELHARGAVEPLLAVLRDGQPATRRLAAVILCMIKDARAVPAFIAALHDRDPEMRQSAARGLGLLEDLRALDPLTLAMKTPDPVVRAYAARALGQLGDPRAVPVLLAAATDIDADVAYNATHALGTLKEARALPALVNLLKSHADEEVRQQAAWALGELGDARAVEPLLAALRDTSYRVRCGAVDALGALRDPRAVEPLLALRTAMPHVEYHCYASGGGQTSWVSDDPCPVRPQVMRALARYNDPRVMEALVDELRLGDYYFLDDIDPDAFSHDPRLITALVEVLGEGKEFGDRYPAITLLARCGAPAVPPLLAALAGDDLRTRRNAALALKQLCAAGPVDAAVRDALYTAMTAGEGDRYDLAVALGMAGDPRALDYLLAQLRQGGGQPYRWIYALGDLPGAQAAEVLLALLTGADAYQRRYALLALRNRVDTMPKEPAPAGLVPALLPLLQDPNKYMRADAAELLGSLGAREAIPALLPLLHEREIRPRTCALYALAQFGAPQAEAPLLAELRDPQGDARRAAYWLRQYPSPRVVDALIAALQHPGCYSSYYAPGYQSVREMAAHALAAIGEQRAVPALIAALDTGYLPGRRAAADALHTLTGQDYGLDAARWRAWRGTK